MCVSRSVECLHRHRINADGLSDRLSSRIIDTSADLDIISNREHVVMALAGGVLGTAASYFATQLMRDVVVNFFDGLVMPLWGVPICLFVALMVGLLSSVVPAFIASRTKVADALRHTG